MADYRVAIVGTGDPNVGRHPEAAGREGFAVAYRHAPCYRELDGCELVACADVVRGNAAAFAETFDLPAGNAYAEYRVLLEEIEPDIVDVCTPAPTHAGIVVGCAESGVPVAIHCEKPVARTWGECRRMAAVCEERGVQLTFNHQRRFGTPWRRAKALLDDGAIGRLERIESGVGPLYSMGTHALDLCGYLNDERRAEWVLAGLDYREENVYSSGAHNENQALVLWEYADGVFGLVAGGRGAGLANAFHRLVGTDGVIEVAPFDADPDLRIRRVGDSTWEPLDAGDGGTGGLGNGYPYMIRAIESVVAALREGREPELGVRNALKSTEIVFAAYESVRSRRRVDLPLAIDDNPLEAMVESGALSPSGEGNVQPARSPVRRMLHLGYATYGMPDADPVDALPRLVDIGYDAIELCASEGWPTSHDRLDAADRNELVSLFRDLGLPSPHVMDLSLRPSSTGEGSPTRERFRATCALARDLTWEGTAVVKTTVPGEPDEWDGADERIVPDLLEFADVAAANDAVLAIEPHVGTPVDTPGKAAALMERTGHRNLGLAFDVSHFPPALFDVERAVELCVPHAVSTHVKDTVVEDGDFRFRLPGETDFDYGWFLEELTGAGYEGPITVEVSAQLWDVPGYDAWEAARSAYGALREPVAAANER